MAKKSSTIHIENCFWKLIDDFQYENDMSSRNTAIECILSEYKALKSFCKPAKLENIEVIDKEKDKDLMTNRLDDLENGMGD